jgi:hypothetical protein
MSQRPESRRSIRLRVSDGLAILFFPGRVPLACSIGDISHSGCCVRLSEGLLHESQIDEWREVLVPGRRIDCELHRPPHLMNAQVRAAVCHTGRPTGTALDVGLAFVDVRPEFASMMKNAMPQFAQEKLHVEPAMSVQSPTGETSDPEPENSSPYKHLSGQPLTDVLVGMDLIDRHAAASALTQAQALKLPLHRFLLKNKLLRPAELCNALAISAGLPVTDLDSQEIQPGLASEFSYLQLMQIDFVPFAESADTLWIAAAAPLTTEAVTELMKTSGKQVMVFLAPANQIRARLFRLRPRPPYQERAHVRLRAALPVSYEFCSEHFVPVDEYNFDGMTANISETGMSISGPAHPTLQPNALLHEAPVVRLNLATPRGEVQALCRLRHIEINETADAPGLPWHMGTEIIEIDPIEADLLRKICIEMGIERMHSRGA